MREVTMGFRGIRALAVAGSLALLAVHSARAQMVAPTVGNQLKGKRVMVLEGGNTTGDHAIARDNTWNNLKAMSTLVGFTLTKGDPKTLNATVLNNVDILVFNYFFETQLNTVFPQAGRDAFMAWLKSGKKGYVGYHTSGANQWPAEWPQYQDEVTLMRYDLHGTGIPQGKVDRTTDPAIAGAWYMAGLPATQNAIDEWYAYKDDSKVFDPALKVKVWYTLANAQALDRAPYPNHPVAWSREDAVGSRYFYSTFIHTGTGANSDWFKSVILRALEYVSGDPIPPDTGVHTIPSRSGGDFAYFTLGRTLKVDLEGGYELSVWSPEGRRLYAMRGNGKATYAPPAFRNPGLYTVRLDSPSGSYAQRVLIR